MSQANKVSGVSSVISKDMVRESVSKMKNRKTAGPSGLVSKLVKKPAEAEADMITDLVCQRIVEVVIPA